MKRNLFIGAIAAVFAITLTATAQTPPSKPQTPPSPTAQAPAATVTVEGCLMREQDVPGREPNIAERAGIREDYILVNATVVKGARPPDATRTTQSRPTQPGTDATRAGQAAPSPAKNLQPMFDVKELDSDRLSPLAGKRVQIEGSWADLERNTSAGASEDLVDIKGLTIREVPGQCPPKP
jgi:hypothetical protein